MLQVLVEPSLREEIALACEVVRQQRNLRELGRADRRHVARGQDLGTAQALVLAEEPQLARGHQLARSVLALEHVPVEVGRTAHGLTRVVNDEVEPVAVRTEVLAERLDARGVAQIEAEDLQPVAPLLEVGLGRVPCRGIAREAGRHDQLSTGAQKLDPRLVADLDATAREERDAPPQVSHLRPLAEWGYARRCEGFLADGRRPYSSGSAQDLPHVGLYTDNGEYGSEMRTRPPTLAAVTKFDSVVGVDRTYDSGVIRIYWLRGLR